MAVPAYLPHSPLLRNVSSFSLRDNLYDVESVMPDGHREVFTTKAQREAKVRSYGVLDRPAREKNRFWEEDWRDDWYAKWLKRPVVAIARGDTVDIGLIHSGLSGPAIVRDVEYGQDRQSPPLVITKLTEIGPEQWVVGKTFCRLDFQK